MENNTLNILIGVMKANSSFTQNLKHENVFRINFDTEICVEVDKHDKITITVNIHDGGIEWVEKFKVVTPHIRHALDFIDGIKRVIII